MTWTPDQLKEYIDSRFNDADKAALLALASIDKRLDNMNEWRKRETDRETNFARRESVEELDAELGKIKADHVQRRDFDDLKGLINQGQGRRTILAAAGGVAIGVLALFVGLLQAQVPTHSAISDQIAREAPSRASVSAQIAVEAPWLAERNSVLARITKLEQLQQRTDIQLAGLIDQVKECRLGKKC